jgi:hypothetical protein
MLCPISLLWHECVRQCQTEDATCHLETESTDIDQQVQMPCWTDRIHPEARVDLDKPPSPLWFCDAEKGAVDTHLLRRPCEDPVGPTGNSGASNMQVVEDTRNCAGNGRTDRSHHIHDVGHGQLRQEVDWHSNRDPKTLCLRVAAAHEIPDKNSHHFQCVLK